MALRRHSPVMRGLMMAISNNSIEGYTPMRTIEDMVQQEVLCCLSSLVSTLSTGDAKPGTDLAELCDRALGLAMPVQDWEEAAIQAGYDGSRGGEREWCEASNIDPIDSEVYEHWAVSPWLAEKLVALGEKVDPDFADLNIWARQNTGQEITADDVIARIYSDMMTA